MKVYGDDLGNQEMHTTWDSLWAAVGGSEKFSVYREIIERAKWRYLSQDMGGRSEGVALEIGCGTGTLASTLSAVGFTTILMDYSETGLDVARRCFEDMPGRERKIYVMGNAFALPLKDGSIDVVVSGGLLEHFEDPVPVVREMARVLKPGGLFYADIWPDRFSTLRLYERMKTSLAGWLEIRMSREQAVDMVRQCGLDPVRIFTAGVMPPRGMRGTTRFKTLDRMERFVVGRLERFWTALDGTFLADWLGAYYYVTARKPILSK